MPRDGTLDGTFDGSLDGTFDRTFDGTFDESLDRTFDRTLDRTLDGCLDGTFDRTFDWGANATYAGVVLVEVLERGLRLTHLLLGDAGVVDRLDHAVDLRSHRVHLVSGGCLGVADRVCGRPCR